MYRGFEWSNLFTIVLVKIQEITLSQAKYLRTLCIDHIIAMETGKRNDGNPQLGNVVLMTTKVFQLKSKCLAI